MHFLVPGPRNRLTRRFIRQLGADGPIVLADGIHLGAFDGPPACVASDIVTASQQSELDQFIADVANFGAEDHDVDTSILTSDKRQLVQSIASNPRRAARVVYWPGNDDDVAAQAHAQRA